MQPELLLILKKYGKLTLMNSWHYKIQ